MHKKGSIRDRKRRTNMAPVYVGTAICVAILAVGVWLLSSNPNFPQEIIEIDPPDGAVVEGTSATIRWTTRREDRCTLSFRPVDSGNESFKHLTTEHNTKHTVILQGRLGVMLEYYITARQVSSPIKSELRTLRFAPLPASEPAPTGSSESP